MKTILFVLMISLCVFFACSCDVQNNFAQNNDSIKIVSWNVQTFFDAQTSGLEYSEFKGSKTNWNKEMYIQRLERLCSSISKINADIIVLQEIESNAVMYDIVNYLHGYMSYDKTYKYMCFGSQANASIGCGVLSRYPLAQMNLHQLDIQTEGKQPQMRPLMEVSVFTQEENSESFLFKLFVCHWKSKSGGQETAEIWQKYQESVVERLLKENIADKNERVIICGDFNRDLNEFVFDSECECCVFMGEIPVQSGWLISKDFAGEGSYRYDGQWEKIDHFFSAGNVQIASFSAIVDGEWACMDDNGNIIPYRFSVWNGQGYSDHFPIECIINLK